MSQTDVEKILEMYPTEDDLKQLCEKIDVLAEVAERVKNEQDS